MDSTKKQCHLTFPCLIYYPKNRYKGNLEEIWLGFDRSFLGSVTAR